MFFPLEKEFLKLAKQGNLIPVYKEVSADLETPVSAFLKLSRGSDYGYLLESVEGQEKIARFSFISCDAPFIIKVKGKTLEILSKNKSGIFEICEIVETNDPLDEIKKFMSMYKFVHLPAGKLPRFSGGLVGYFGYDTVRFFENIPDKNKLGASSEQSSRDLYGASPDDAIFILTDTLLIFDHLNHKLKILHCVYLKDNNPKTVSRGWNGAVSKIEEVMKKLKKTSFVGPTAENKKKIKIKYFLTENEWAAMINKAKKYIKSGDVIQVVLSQALSAYIYENPFNIYRKLRGLNPSAYMFYVKFKDFHLVGSSPEMLVRCENNTVITRPIAGTRKRGLTPEKDEGLEEELLRDEKEKAEHIMLVDLGRNDLGRVCEYGTVQVSEFMRIEKYSHVMHIVSEVRGRLKRGKDMYDCLRAAFPAGTVTGSPKVRAMEIIDELENSRRGPYAGAVGYFSFSGNLDTCITIRTIIIDKKTAYIQAGAGIVADSMAGKEYQETLNKARAQIEALTGSV